ncbi:MAG: pitrilysin family protein [bacterium]|nr:pitrilysin family protein [bacterium]
MKKIFCFLIAGLFFAVPVLAFEPPTPLYETLPNGLKIVLLEDHELPTFELVLYLKSGSLYDSPKKSGIAALTGTVLRTGGTLQRTPEMLDQEFDNAAVSFSVSTKREVQVLTIHCLREDAYWVLDRLFEILTTPRFDEERFLLAQSQLLEEIRRQNEDRLNRGGREFQKLIYGSKSRWASFPTEKSVKKIKRKELVSFWQNYFVPNGAVIGVSGDFIGSEMLKTLQEKTTGWKSHPVKFPKILPIPETFEERNVLIPDAVSQTTLFVGHLGGERSNPDKYALTVMNYILGGIGSMTSRLGEEIRSREGKAYSVWSEFGFGEDRGVFSAGAQTKAENSSFVVEKIQEIIRQMSGGINLTEEEVAKAKKGIVTALVFEYENRFNIVDNETYFQFLGYPQEYLKRYQEGIEKVSLEEVRRVAGQYLHPEGLKILMIAPEETILPSGRRFEKKESL